MRSRTVTRAFKIMTAALAVLTTATLVAQDAQPAAPSRPGSPVSLKLSLVFSRYQGEKKISSMPYNLSVITGRGANLRMGTKIPVMMVSAARPEADGKPIPQIGPIQYQDVGTNIDCGATEVQGGGYQLTISVDDSSVYPDEQPGGAKGNPSFRSFRANNSMVLKNGETGQFSTATDKVTGETVRVDVTLTVMK